MTEEFQAKASKLLEFYERTIKNIEDRVPFYLIALAIYSLAHNFIAIQTWQIFSEDLPFSLLFMLLFFTPYFLTFIFFAVLIFRFRAKRFNQLLRRTYFIGFKLTELELDEIAKMAHIVQKRWESILLFIYVYFLLSPTLLFITLMLSRGFLL